MWHLAGTLASNWNEDTKQDFVMLFGVFDEGNYHVDSCWTLNSSLFGLHDLAMV